MALSDDEVTGREFIELAARQHPEVNDISFGYGGQAVCMLADVGTTEEDCLQPGEPFWGYWRSEDGRWEWSSEGFTATTVEDGDIEGWSWDNETGPAGRNRPPHPAFDSTCGYSPDEPRDQEEPDSDRRTPTEGSPHPGTGVGDSSVDDGSGPKPRRPDAERSGTGEGEGRETGPPLGEKRLDSAPLPSEFNGQPSQLASPSAGSSLPSGATSAAAEPREFPRAGVLAIAATVGMAGLAAYLLTRRKSL